MDNPYASPSAPSFGPRYSPQPPVVFWYRMFCSALTALYIVVAIAGVAVVLYRKELVEDDTPEEFWLFYGIFLIVLGVVLLAVYAFGAAMPAKPWTWVYGIVVIALTMTSCCCVPAAVPVLIYWIKPETQSYFGR